MWSEVIHQPFWHIPSSWLNSRSQMLELPLAMKLSEVKAASRDLDNSSFREKMCLPNINMLQESEKVIYRDWTHHKLTSDMAGLILLPPLRWWEGRKLIALHHRYWVAVFQVYFLKIILCNYYSHKLSLLIEIRLYKWVINNRNYCYRSWYSISCKVQVLGIFFIVFFFCFLFYLLRLSYN